jgi:hypothetical protein
MLRTIKTLLAMGACVALLLLVGAAPANPEGLHAGKQWLDRTPAERNVYVQAFIERYWKGSQTACRLADTCSKWVNRIVSVKDRPGRRDLRHCCFEAS